MIRKIVGIFVIGLLMTTSIVITTKGNKSGGLTYSEKDGIFTGMITIPNDPEFSKQWALHNTGQTGGIPDVDIDALEAWEIETGDPNIIIAIIDSGIDYTHPDLIDNIWINQDEIPDNSIDDDDNGYIDDCHGYDFKNDDADTLDEHGHGTTIAGVIGAVTNNNIGIAGTCWDCQIMPLKFWNTDSRLEAYVDRVDNIIEAIEYAADNGADVISMSFGVDISFFRSDEFMRVKNAIDYAYDKGCVLVAAAVNDNTSEPYYPGAWENVICVGAIDQNNNRMEYQYPNHGQIVISNYGDWVDVAAPGEEIYTTSPTYDCVITSIGREKKYTLMSGTSLATPFVAGLAGLLLSHNSTLTNDEIKDIIRANVDPYDSEYYIGTGRINAYNSIMRLNTQPEIPDTPSGKTNGKPGKEYSFTSSASDEDGDQLWYFWDWGDGNFSEWIGPYASDEKCEISYAWQQEGNYSIKVKVNDRNGGESYWSDPLPITMPYTHKTLLEQFFEWFFQRFPNAFPLLRQRLGY